MSADAGYRSPGALLADVPPRRAVVHHWNRLRFVALVDIAGFHLTQEHLVGGIGLPVFLLLSLSLAPSALRAPDWRVVARRRGRRLAGPWLFWNVALGALLALRAWHHGAPPLGWANRWMLVGGTQPHLWFLPFATVAGLVVVGIDRWARRFSAARVAAVAVPVAALAGLLHPRLPYLEPFSQWAFALPSLPLALGLSALLREGGARAGVARARPLGLFVAAYTLLAVLVWGLGLDAEGDALRFAGAAGALLVLWLLPDRADPVTSTLEPLLMGVFVLHISVGFLGVHRLVPPGALPAAAETLLVVVATGALVAVLRRTPLRPLL